MAPSPQKRRLSSFPELVPLVKKPKLDLPHPLTHPHDQVQVDIHSAIPLEFAFGDLAHEFIATPVPGNDLKGEPAFDPLFDECPLSIVPVNDTSDISSDEDKNDKKSHLATLPTSPLSSVCEQRTPSSSTPPSTQPDIDSSKKRQADRAARNRESSRRAREKQKNRFRALESGYFAMQEAVQRYKMQIEHLQSLLDRATIIQQSCNNCSYKAALSQQPPRRAPLSPHHD